MIYDNSLWFQDIDLVLEYYPEFKDLAGSSILVTGAGGLICSALVDILIRYNESHQDTIEILAGARNLSRLKARFGDFCDKDYFVFVPYDANNYAMVIPQAADFIIHGAGNASPNKIVKEPVETMLSNFAGLYTLLQYAGQAGTRRVLYISSSEVYGKKNDTSPYKEADYGYIDLLSPRNSYSVGKRAAETLCAAYSDEYGVETVIVRPGHIYGPTASKSDNRVSSAWAYAAANGVNIVMKSDGAQIRSYCYCLDCASAILKVLMNGENTGAYNISNPDSVISIRDMAEIVAKAGNVRLLMELPTEEEKRGFNPMSNSSLDSTSLQALGWRGIFDATTGFEHTVHLMKSVS